MVERAQRRESVERDLGFLKSVAVPKLQCLLVLPMVE